MAKAGCRRVRLENAPSVDQSHHRAVQFQSDKSQECTVDFTTHDTNLLNASLFRRDQIWFTQKDSFGASELYSLAEYKVRNSAPFEKEYLMGKYGGIPVIGQFERLFDLREEEYGSTDEQA